MEQINKTGLLVEQTIDTHKLIGARVLSGQGNIAGRVKKIQVNPQTLDFEGIVVKRHFWELSYYISKDYIQRISKDAVFLTAEPSILLKFKRVITEYGKIVGWATQVKRNGITNDIEYIIVRSLLSKPKQIDVKKIKSIGTSIIVKNDAVGE
ncbi:MAG: PRC-barrel domain-containing protein [Candidatus Woesearchaeota archaeon]